MLDNVIPLVLQMSGHSGYDPASPQGLQSAEFRDSHPISDADPHMFDWNGGVSREQLRRDWRMERKPPV